MTTSSLNIPSLQNRVSAEEWQLRVDLAAAYRLVAAFKWDDMVFTHISARLPDSHDSFLINPYGLMFDEITASSLIKVDANGNKLVFGREDNDEGQPTQQTFTITTETIITLDCKPAKLADLPRGCSLKLRLSDDGHIIRVIKAASPEVEDDKSETDDR